MPKTLDPTRDASAIETANVREAAILHLTYPEEPVDLDVIRYWDFEAGEGSLADFALSMFPYALTCTVVAHDADTTIKLLRRIWHQTGYLDENADFDEIGRYCTMCGGKPYVTNRPRQGRKRVTKPPELQELVSALTGFRLLKQSLFEDLLQVQLCFKLLRSLQQRQAAG